MIDIAGMNAARKVVQDARVEQAGSRVSMDGRGRVFDNIFIERLWRSLKYEDISLRDYVTGPELIRGLPPGLRGS